MARVRILNEAEVRGLIGPVEAQAECRRAFEQLGRGEVELPDVITIEVAEHHGEVHAKGGYIHGAPHFSIKVATGFADNPARGLAASSGAVWVFSAVTGHLAAMLLDNGFLTELRTGAAGGVAADLLARPVVDTVGIVGAGSQARYQLAALLQVRDPRRIILWNRDRGRAEHCAREMSANHGRSVEVASELKRLVEAADLIVTTTPSREPLIRSEWVGPGTHLTAMGADTPSKCELDPVLMGRAAVVVDRLSQCLTQGELRTAVAAGTMTASAVRAELGEVAAGRKPGRLDQNEITIADLTGVGVLDAAVASAVTRRAEATGTGQWLEM